MKFETKIRILLYKRYFDTGLALTHYFFYVIALFGITSGDLQTTLWLAIAYGILCFFLGWFWLNTELYKADNELSNRFNPFVSHVKRKLLSNAKIIQR